MSKVVRVIDLSFKRDDNPSWKVKPEPNEKVTINMDVFEQFMRFVNERNEIWWRRVVEKKSAPWTDDPILREYHFTNVFRDLDRGTLYYIDNILSKGSNDEKDKRNVVFNTLIYRVFNRVETYDAHGFIRLENFEEDFERMKRILRERRAQGHSITTNAHYLPTFSQYNPDPKTRSNKTENLFCVVQLWYDNFDEYYEGIVKAKDMEEQRNFLMDMPGLGKFLAYEVCCDLVMAPRYYNYTIVPWDDDSWTSDGPGAQRGINFIFENKGNLGYIDIIHYLRSIFYSACEYFGIQFRNPPKLKWNLRAQEHSLCEFQKYRKAYLGTGRPKNKFQHNTKNDDWLNVR